MARSDGDTQVNRRTQVNPTPGGPNPGSPKLGSMVLGRRRLLRHAGTGLALWTVGAGAGISLSGCTDTRRPPTPSASAPAPTPTPTPTPLPGTVEAATLEAELAAYADAILTRTRRLTGRQKRLLALIRDAHRAHVTVLSSTTPFDLPTPPPSGSPTPASPAPASPTTADPTPASASSGQTQNASAAPTISVPAEPDAAIKKLIKHEAAAAADHRRRALTDAGPADRLQLLALLWGSLCTAAGCYRAALTAGLDPQAELVAAERFGYALPAPEMAVDDALEQTYALIFGYQTALAHLYGAAADRARSSLAGYRDLRDALSSLLVADKQQPPAPHPAYQLPIQPTTQARATDLAGRMETAMLPYLGQWLATSSDRQPPLVALTNSATAAQMWTRAIAVWPGWPTA